MKILIVSNAVPSPEQPLLGIFELDQAKALMQAGQEVILFAIDLRSLRRKRKFGITKGVKNGVPWYSISWPVGAVPTALFCRIGAIAIKRLYNDVFSCHNAPDIIHAHFEQIGYIAATLAKAKNIPLVITEHSTAMNQQVCDPTLLKYAANGYHNANQVIAVSSALAKNIFRQTGVNSIVIPNVLPMDGFASAAPRQHDGFGFAVTANLIERKGHAILLRAFAAVHAQYPNTYLGIFGDGPLRSTLEEQAKALKIDSCVRFYGRVERTVIALSYGEYDCFVLPSFLETFGVVYIEAMAAGLPVIATRCEGPEDFVTAQNGILIDVDNQEQLENAMVTMIRNKNRYDSKLIHNYVVEKYSPCQIAKQLINVYTEIFNRANHLEEN